MRNRYWFLVLGIVILGAVTTLASSLHDVHFESGRALSTHMSTSAPITPSAVSNGPETPLWKILLLWGALVIVFALFLYLLPPELRKKIMLQFIRLAITLLAVLIALRYRLIQLPILDGMPANPAGIPAFGLNANGDVPTFHPPESTSWVTYVVSLAATVALLLCLWAGFRWWRRWRARSLSPLRAIADIAQSSLDDLASGRDWGDVIIQSYVRMNEVVGVRKGLNRPEAATPREFAVRLESAGLPAGAVRGLTRLFESVRYGARNSSQSEMNEAVACLNSILQACGVA